jgi:hypothetical protein
MIIVTLKISRINQRQVFIQKKKKKDKCAKNKGVTTILNVCFFLNYEIKTKFKVKAKPKT